MSLIKTWAPHFQSSVRMRGRAYQMAGRVRRLVPRDGELVRAEVVGSQAYTVVIRGEGSSAAVSCTCPFYAGGSYCKHIWAVILDAQYNPLDGGGDSAADLASRETSLRPPKARRRGHAQHPPRPREPEWVGRLSLLRSGDGAADPLATSGFSPSRQICYVVSRELSRHQGLVVLLRQREPTQTGWSRFKRLKIAAAGLAELADPADRELCALLLGAERLAGEDSYLGLGGGEPHDAFRLPAGARRSLLRQMIATGRCFLQSDDKEAEEPLTWDGQEPWALWLVGRFDGEALFVGLELRRQAQCMGIGQPALLLGRLDGVAFYDGKAAPFDDRGAARFVRQFREDGGEGSAEIRVPASDTDRFLDRLYTLPYLPEIEMPPGLGRSERRVRPQPHLEIFSPESRTIALAAGLPRSQLLARVWFAYEDHRVRPGDPSRFVLTEALESDAAEAAPAEASGKTVPVSESESGAEDVTEVEDLLEDADEPADEEASGGESSPDNGQEHETQAVMSNLIRRDTLYERDALVQLAALGFRQHPGNGADTLLLPVKQMPQAVAELLRLGWAISADERAIRRPAPPRLSITSGIDWFELHGGVRFDTQRGEQVVPLPELLAAARSGKTMITLGDGSEGLLPSEWLGKHGLLASMGQLDGDHLTFKATQAALLDAMLDEADLADVDQRFAQVRARLAEFKGVTPRDAAPSFQGTLRPYQKDGVGWMAFLRHFGMGGVLADDMGLGKTIQVLAMLDARYGETAGTTPTAESAGTGEATDPASSNQKSDIRNQKSPHRPSLIVVPRSVVFNWIDEAARFAPGLRVQAYTGADRNALREAFKDHDVIVTSYGLLRRDIEDLVEHEFDYVVLDEAQAIKNPGSQSAKAARLLRAEHRLALTGTPVENHLGDLWSIFEFLNPGMLGSSGGFGRLVRGEVPAAEDGDAAAGADGGQGAANGRGGAPAFGNGRSNRPALDADAAAQIAQALRPFILRRTKQQVLDELPEKTEQTILCELEPEQRELYEQLRQHYRAALLGATAGSEPDLVGGRAAPMMVLEALLRLRQAACHPGLIDPRRAGEPSAKLDTLLERLTDLIEEGHKALVFSQFTTLLALLRQRLDERGVVYEYLDGQTRDRRKRVQRFQSDPACPLFLISLKAGGLGLNLTAAEYVFILDPWWNPAVEAQAIDRTHRIGQTRHVFAYRLICEDTVEQRIAELQQKKKKLADAILGGQENLLRSLSREDLERLLS